MVVLGLIRILPRRMRSVLRNHMMMNVSGFELCNTHLSSVAYIARLYASMRGPIFFWHWQIDGTVDDGHGSRLRSSWRHRGRWRSPPSFPVRTYEVAEIRTLPSVACVHNFQTPATSLSRAYYISQAYIRIARFENFLDEVVVFSKSVKTPSTSL
jgi:hypothetical protein